MNSAEKYINKAKEWAKAILNDSLGSLELNEEEKKDLHSLRNGSYSEWRSDLEAKFDEELVWKNIESCIIKGKKKTKVIQLLKYWPSVAAILVIGLLSYQAYFIYNDYQRKHHEALMVPGQSKAYLEIDNTHRIELGQLDTLMTFNGTNLQLKADRISYTGLESKNTEKSSHKLRVPRNAEYCIQLADGSVVWVNSESTLEFDTRFDGNKRIVDLSGEAYFEVKKNPDQPFIVRTENADVRVLGTKFNVRAYNDEAYTVATLNEGRVRVQTDEISQDLWPDEQLVFENATGKITKKVVDADIYSAWVNGKFVFKDQRLEDILHTISRWYDIQVFFENQELQEERFSLSLNRDADISDLLEHIEMTESVQFDIKGKALIVK
ncbi:FecR family protein [Marinifilum sp.]|uniref:FecR family protein n=1 Tax=Marinifilum sp. TaxID=2033137 RepID=UPI003BACD16C